MAHARHSRPCLGLGFQINILKPLQVVLSSLGCESECASDCLRFPSQSEPCTLKRNQNVKPHDTIKSIVQYSINDSGHSLKPQTPKPKTQAPKPKHQTPNTKHQTPNTKHQALNTKSRTPNTKHRTPNLKTQTPNTEPQTPNSKPQTSNPNPQAPDSNTTHQTPSAGGKDAATQSAEASTGSPRSNRSTVLPCSYLDSDQ